MSNDENINFNIGIDADPRTQAALESLVGEINVMQDALSASAGAWVATGQTAQASIEAATTSVRSTEIELGGVTQTTRRAYAAIGDWASAMADADRTGFRGTRAELETMISGTFEAMSVAERLGETFVVAGEHGEAMAETTGSRFDQMLETIQGLPPHIRRVMEQLGSIPLETASRTNDALNRIPPNNPPDNPPENPPDGNNRENDITQRFRQAYRERVLAHAQAYREMARDLDGYEAAHGSHQQQVMATMRQANQALRRQQNEAADAVQAVGQTVVRGTRSFIQLSKGIAEVSMSNKEDVAALMHTLAIAQGAFDIFEGGVEIFEAITDARKAWTRSSEAMNTVMRTQQALGSAQFSWLQAHNAQLLQEAAAANAAASAEQRLANARGAGVGGVGRNVANAATNTASAIGNNVVRTGGTAVATRAAPAAAAAGAVPLTTAAAGLALPAVAAAAALTALGAVAWQTTEILSGRAESEKSITMTVARTEVSLVGWAMKQTGLFNTMDSTMTQFAQGASKWVDEFLSGDDYFSRFYRSLNMFGDLAGMVASQVQADKMAQKGAQQKIVDEANRNRDNIEREGLMTSERTDLQQRLDLERKTAELPGQQKASGAVESAIQAEAARRMAAEQQLIDDFNAGVGGSLAAVANARKNLEALKQTQRDSVLRQSAAAGGVAQKQVLAEQNAQYELSQKILSLEAKRTALKASQSDTLEEQRDVEKQLLELRAMQIDSMDRMRSATEKYNEERIAGEEKIRELDQANYDATISRIKSLADERRGAAANFSKMGDIEKDFAKRAIVQARAGGAASLTDEQRDLLRQVGTAEANRFADVADQAEAKQSGFDQTFGVGLDQESKQLEQTRQQLEAKIQTSYNVAVKMEFDTANLVSQVATQVRAEQERNNKLVLAELRRELDLKQAENTQEAQRKMNELREAQRAGTRS